MSAPTIYNPETDSVIVSSGTDKKAYSLEEYAAFKVCVAFMHFQGSFRKLLKSDALYMEYYLLFDGFGKLEAGEVDCFDWSHIRDSSKEALIEGANSLLKNIFRKDLSAHIAERRKLVEVAKVDMLDTLWN